MSNKNRVFVAVYTRPGSSTMSSLNSTKPKPTPQKYHWGIWIEPKHGSGAGTSFDLEDAAGYSSVTNPFGWRLHIDDHKAPPARMLGRIMIGKIVEGMTTTDIANLLRQVQLPSEPGSAIADAAAWTQAAIQELQEVGCAETFSVEAFMADAVGHAVAWHGKGGAEVQKVNYTWSRTFP